MLSTSYEVAFHALLGVRLSHSMSVGLALEVRCEQVQLGQYALRDVCV